MIQLLRIKYPAHPFSIIDSCNWKIFWIFYFNCVGLTAAASAADAVIHKKHLKSGGSETTLISIEEMKKHKK